MLSFFIYTFGIINTLFYGFSAYNFISNSEFGITAWLAGPCCVIAAASLVAMAIWHRSNNRKQHTWTFTVAAGFIALGILVMAGDTIYSMQLDGAGSLLFLLWPIALVQLFGAVFWLTVAVKLRPIR